MSIGVIGAGAFGTALAISLSSDETHVVLWGRNASAIDDLVQTRTNADRLSGITLPLNLKPTSDLDDLAELETILLAIPMQKLGAFLAENGRLLDGKSLVACCKGIDLGTFKGPSGIIAEHCPHSTVAVLTGPSFAADIARGLPTALTLACNDAKAVEQLQRSLTRPMLRLYRSADVVGAELGGALKNVVAIACGAVIGAGLGESARAALMTRGYAEMILLAQALNAQPATLAGLSGFGDLALTCSTDMSRNFRFGLSLGQNIPFDASITVEGVATAIAANALAQSLEIELPITKIVAELAAQEISVQDALTSLLSRPLREE